MNFNLADRTIFLVVSGSRAYGTSNPDSDWDYRGIVIPPNDSYIGILDKFEQVVDSNDNHHVHTHFDENLVHKDSDMQIMELSKFVNLAAQCNPSVIEILFTDPKHFVVKHPLMDKLLDNKKLFLSKSAKARFCGYALSQLKRIKRHKKWIDNPPDHKPTRTEFGLPESGMLSGDQIGAANALIQREIDSFIIDQTHLPDDVKIELNAGLGRMMRAVWDAVHPKEPYPIGDNYKFKSTEEALYWSAAQGQGFTSNFLEVLGREKRYRSAKTEWDSYQNWLKNRRAPPVWGLRHSPRESRPRAVSLFHGQAGSLFRLTV